jgi:hypothetical protein
MGVTGKRKALITPVKLMARPANAPQVTDFSKACAVPKP